MTKKDYQLIATALSSSEAIGPDQRKALAEDFATLLAADNPRFNSEAFIAASLTGDVKRRPPKKQAGDEYDTFGQPIETPKVEGL